MVFFLSTFRLQFCMHSSLSFAVPFHSPNAYAMKTLTFCASKFHLWVVIAFPNIPAPPRYPIRSHPQCMKNALFWGIALCNFKIHPVSTFRMEEPVSFKTLTVIHKTEQRHIQRRLYTSPSMLFQGERPLLTRHELK